MFEIAIGLILGIAAYGLLPASGEIIFGAVLIAVGILLHFIGRHRLGFFVCAVLAGVVLMAIKTPPAVATGEYVVEGIVTDAESELYGSTYTLTDVTLDGQNLGAKLAVRTEHGDAIAIGTRIKAVATVCMPNSEVRSLKWRDYNRSMANGIGAYAEADSISVLSSHNAPVIETLFGVRAFINESIANTFGSDSSIMSALIIGERSELGSERVEIYRTSGVSHLLAISGFHMSVLTAVFGLMIPKRYRWIRFASIGAFMLAYCSVAVYAPGLVRSAIMMACMLFSVGLEKRSDSLSALSIAAVLILAFNPYQLYSAGFQLSICACLGIIMLYSQTKSALQRLKLPAASAISVCLCASVATMPLQMLYFGSLSAYIIPANLVAVPAFTVVIISGILVTLMGFVLPQAAAVIAVVPRSVLFVCERYLGLLLKLPGAEIHLASPPMLCCAIFLIALFMLSKFVLRPLGKRLEYTAVTIFLFTAVYFIDIIII